MKMPHKQMPTAWMYFMLQSPKVFSDRDNLIKSLQSFKLSLGESEKSDVMTFLETASQLTEKECKYFASYADEGVDENLVKPMKYKTFYMDVKSIFKSI